MSVEELSAEEVATRAMNVAASMCVYTNDNFIQYSLEDTSVKKEKLSD
jgi:ATP-dependent protease HslVU (ClpYQ) peptidase subunit